MKKDLKKGFTLIELLVTIVLISLITMGGIYNSEGSNRKTEKESNDISISSIKESARIYTQDFKSESMYWFVDNDNHDKEYACTTIGMLINKGLLNDPKLDKMKIKEEDKTFAVTRETSVKVVRDIDTKVYDDEMFFDDLSCNDNANIEISFSYDGVYNEDTKWYNSDVTVNMSITNEDQIDKAENFAYDIRKNEEKYNNPLLSVSSDGKTIVISEEGKDMDLCVSVISLRGNIIKKCTKKLDMDKTGPTAPEIIVKNQKDSDGTTASISKESTDRTSGINRYEYFRTSSSDIPTKDTIPTGNASKSMNFGKEYEGHYVYFRAVDNAGNIGDWSLGKILLPYSCPEGTLTVDSEKGTICIVTALSKAWYDTEYVCTKTGCKTCEVTTYKTIKDCDICGYLYYKDDGNPYCDRCMDACDKDDLKCKAACKDECQGIECKSCSVPNGTKTVTSCPQCGSKCVEGYNKNTYYCKDGWSIYSGTVDSDELVCYKQAIKG